MNTDQTTFIDLLRHGEADGGMKFRGTTDDPLTELGQEQMWRALGAHYPWRRIISSPLRRCAEFSRALSARAAIPLAANPAFTGWDFGAWDGKSQELIMQTDAEALKRFREDPLRYSPPGGEALASIAARSTQALTELLQQHPGEHLLIVCHAVPIRCIVAKLLRMPLDHIFSIEVGPGAFTRLLFTHSPRGIRGRLLSHAGFLPTPAK